MNQRAIWRWMAPAMVGLAAGLALPRLSGQATAPAPKADQPPYRGLDANLYMQTAAEYRACCFQAYNLATLRLTQMLAGRPKDARPPAVVMDLDETVLDNAAFQSMMLRANRAFDLAVFDYFEDQLGGWVELIPGAKEFILDAESRGATVVYITNRNDRYRDRTKAVLTRLGIPAKEDKHLKQATTTSDKTARRAEVAADYDVVMLVGDNLRDFDEQFRFPRADRSAAGAVDAAIAARAEKVNATRADWGNKWIILPNPVYGEWSTVFSQSLADLDRLKKSPPIPAGK